MLCDCRVELPGHTKGCLALAHIVLLNVAPVQLVTFVVCESNECGLRRCGGNALTGRHV